MHYADYELFNRQRYLEDKKIIIYGAGKCGRQAGEMLRAMGYEDYVFCDQDSEKWGTELDGHCIYSLSEIAERASEARTVMVIAIESEKIQREAEELLSVLGGITLISFVMLMYYASYMSDSYAGKYAYFEIMSAYYLQASVHFARLYQRGNSEIILYLEEKVGSTSIEGGLQEREIKRIKFHHLFCRHMMFERLTLDDKEYSYMDIYKKKRYVREIQKLLEGKKIITMVRDPVAQVISHIFQHLTANKVYPIEWFISGEMREGRSFNEIILKYIEMKIEEKADLFSWFDEELKQACGTDIYAYPFDRERGYSVIHGPKCDILCMKTEKLDTLNPVIADFLGVPDFQVKKENVGERKRYRHLYHETLKRIEIPERILDYYYKDNPKMEHFYTREEREYFYRKWRSR